MLPEIPVINRLREQPLLSFPIRLIFREVLLFSSTLTSRCHMDCSAAITLNVLLPQQMHNPAVQHLLIGPLANRCVRVCICH